MPNEPKQPAPVVGAVVELEGVKYGVETVCHGYAAARDLCRARNSAVTGHYYRRVQGKWCVLRRVQSVPDYFLR